MFSEKRKVIKKDPQSNLQDSFIAKYTLSKQNTTDIPKYSELPGMQTIKKEVHDRFLFPLLNTNTNLSNKILLKGSSGIGKTFLLKSICKENDFVIIKSKSCELKESYEKTRLFKKPLIHITDLATIEDGSVLDELCETLIHINNVFIVAEVISDINVKLKKYDCFENEINFNLPNEIERKEILLYLIKKYYENNSLLSENKLINVDFVCEIAKNTPGFNPSDLNILHRKAVTKSVINNEKLSMLQYKEVLKETKNVISSISFDDIGGLEDVKKEIYNSIILPSLHSQKYKEMGVKKPCGILLFGPPGCGKTIIAKAISSMAHYNFISIKGPELINKFVGETEKELRDLFEKAKQLQPCVIFFDEIDSLCNKRGDTNYNDRIVNQILTLMDGFEDRGDVFVIGATNRINTIDEAFLRPGRFDKIIKIPLPNIDERKKIFEKCIKDMNVDNFDFKRLKTDGFSGADIYGLVKEAATLFICESIDNSIKKVQFKHFKEAVVKINTINNQKN